MIGLTGVGLVGAGVGAYALGRSRGDPCEKDDGYGEDDGDE